MKVSNLFVGNLYTVKILYDEDPNPLIYGEILKKTIFYKISRNYAKDMKLGGIYHIGMPSRAKIGGIYADRLTSWCEEDYHKKRISKQRLLKYVV